MIPGMGIAATLDLTELDLLDLSEWHVVALIEDASEHGPAHLVPAPPFANVPLNWVGEDDLVIGGVRVLRDGRPEKDIPIAPAIPLGAGNTLTVTLSLGVQP